MSWNYNKNTRGALKTLPIHDETTCTSCFFHADAGYTVEIDVKHYHLETVVAEVYGDVELEMALMNPGAAVNVKKVQRVMDAELFRVTFMLGPIPITVSLNLGVDLGLHLTVQEIGKTPHIQAQGSGHVRFGKQYHRGAGWSPIHTHSLDLSFDSAGGTLKADLLLYANVVPTLKLHHIGSASVIITPALDVGLTAGLPQGECDFKPLQDKHPVCAFSEGVDTGCALGITVSPSINVALHFELDITLFHKTIYKKMFQPIQLLQKTFAIQGFPKCLVGSWSKASKRRRSLLTVLATGVAGTTSPLSTTTATRKLGDTNVGAIRSDLPSPRDYLKNTGKNTPCTNDCTGQGFCVDATANSFGCFCLGGWTGDDCATAVVEVDATGVTVVQGGLHPQPNMCGHGKVFHRDTSVESMYLHTCQGRTHEHYCASGNATEMKVMDDTVRAALHTFAEAGYSCSSAFAELQCRLTFPSVHSKDNQRLLPVSHESCVELFTPCLGEELAEKDICSSGSSGTGSDFRNGGYAGVAAANSPWNTIDLPKLFANEHVVPGQKNEKRRLLVSSHPMLTPPAAHSACTIAPTTLQGCPERQGLLVHVNLDVFGSVAEMDAFVVKQVKTLTVQGDDATVCKESYRLHLCQSTMPVCNHYGNPQKMLWVECVDNYMQCPELGAGTGSEDPSYYGLVDDFSAHNITNRAMYAKDVCSDQSDRYTRQFVGKHAVECGMEPTMLGEGTAWFDNVAVFGPVLFLVGLLVGALLVGVVAVMKIKQMQKSIAEGAVLKCPPTTIELPSGGGGEYDPRMSMTSAAFPTPSKDTAGEVQKMNPMAEKNSLPSA